MGWVPQVTESLESPHVNGFLRHLGSCGLVGAPDAGVPLASPNPQSWESPWVSRTHCQGAQPSRTPRSLPLERGGDADAAVG